MWHISTVPSVTASSACRAGTISPPAKVWMVKLPSLIAETSLANVIGPAEDGVERLRKRRSQAPGDLRHRLGDGRRGKRRGGCGGAGAGNPGLLDERTTIHTNFLPLVDQHKCRVTGSKPATSVNTYTANPPSPANRLGMQAGIVFLRSWAIGRRNCAIAAGRLESVAGGIRFGANAISAPRKANHVPAACRSFDRRARIRQLHLARRTPAISGGRRCRRRACCRCWFPISASGWTSTACSPRSTG